MNWFGWLALLMIFQLGLKDLGDINNHLRGLRCDGG